MLQTGNKEAGRLNEMSLVLLLPRGAAMKRTETLLLLDACFFLS